MKSCSSQILRISKALRTARETRVSGTFILQRSYHDNMKVAVLYQACEPPMINGVKKPMKPGGKTLINICYMPC